MRYYAIERTLAEIDEQMQFAYEGIANGTAYRACTYEEGVDAAFRWLFGLTDDAPLGDDE